MVSRYIKYNVTNSLEIQKKKKQPKCDLALITD